MKVVIRKQYESFSVKVSNTETLEDFTRLIASREDVVPPQITLLYKRRILKGNLSLKDLGMSEGNVIDLIITKPKFQMELDDCNTLSVTEIPKKYENIGPEEKEKKKFLFKEKIRMLMNMGYKESQSKTALKLADGNIQLAASYLPLDDDKIVLIKTTRRIKPKDREVPEPSMKNSDIELNKPIPEVTHPVVVPSNTVPPKSNPQSTIPQQTTPKTQEQTKTAGIPSMNLPPMQNTLQPNVFPMGSLPQLRVPLDPNLDPSKLPINETELMSKVISFISNPKKLKVIVKLIEGVNEDHGQALKNDPTKIIEAVLGHLNAKKELIKYTKHQRSSIKRVTNFGINKLTAIELLNKYNWDIDKFEEDILKFKENMENDPNFSFGSGKNYNQGQMPNPQTSGIPRPSGNLPNPGMGFGRIPTTMVNPIPSVRPNPEINIRPVVNPSIDPKPNPDPNPVPNKPIIDSNPELNKNTMEENKLENKDELPKNLPDANPTLIKNEEDKSQKGDSASVVVSSTTLDDSEFIKKEKPKLKPRGGFGPGRVRFGDN